MTFISARIKNYQSHEDTLLEFDPGVNIIIGDTDSGKTAILRALKWGIKNRPTGDGFRSWWEHEETEVIIETEEGNNITRIKSKGNNKYLLNGVELSAIGVKVPEEVEQALNLSEINLQSQFEMPFLLNSTDGEVAIHFNKIAHIEKIDTSNRALTSWITKLKQNKETTKEDLGTLKEDLKKYNYLIDLEDEIKALEKADKEITDLCVTEIALETLILQIQAIESEVEEYADLLHREDEVLSCLQLIEEIAIDKTNQNLLISTINSIKKNKSILKRFKPISEINIDQLVQDHVQIENLQAEKIKLQFLIRDTNTIQIQYNKYISYIKRDQEKFDEMMPDVCPLCEQEIKK